MGNVLRLQIQSAVLLAALHLDKTGASYSGSVLIQPHIYDFLLIHTLFLSPIVSRCTDMSVSAVNVLSPSRIPVHCRAKLIASHRAY